MKKIAIPVLLSAVLILGYGCKKDHDSEPSSYLTATVDGQSYKATTTSVLPHTGVDPDEPDGLILDISSADAAGDLLGFQVEFPDGKLTTGTFTFTAQDQHSLMYMHQTKLYATLEATNPEGEVIISKATDHLIQGTFQGKPYDANDGSAVTVTEGRFSLTY